jgi:peroxiredoxin
LASISPLEDVLEPIDKEGVDARVVEPISWSPQQVHQRRQKMENVDMNKFKDICVVEDGHQFITPTTGHPVSAKNISAGVRSMRYLGQLSDASAQRLFQFRNQGSE